jgi:hypothetical protein
MIKYVLYVIIILGIMGVSTACDSTEQPFIINNTLSQPVNLQILEQGVAGGTSRLGIARKTGETLKPSLLLAPGETTPVGTAGVVGGRIGYVIIIENESGKELFRRQFPRDELIKHEFRVIITEAGIEYSL